MIEFFVPGEPRAKQSFRVGVGRRGGYTPARIKAWQADVGWAAQNALHGLEAWDVLYEFTKLAVILEFHLGNHRRIDGDNLSKAVLDGLNGIAWKDDRQITEIHIYKNVTTDPQRVGVNVCYGTAIEISRRLNAKKKKPA